MSRLSTQFGYWFSGYFYPNPSLRSLIGPLFLKHVSLRTRSWGFSFGGTSIWRPNDRRHEIRSTPKQIEHVVQLVREMGMKDHVIQGTERTVVAVIGDDRNKDRSVFEIGRRSGQGDADSRALQDGVEGNQKGAVGCPLFP